MIFLAVERQALFFPEEKHKLIELILKPPREVGRALEGWSFRELKRTAIKQGIVKSISIATIQRVIQLLSYSLDSS